jgi:hypothetical protein
MSYLKVYVVDVRVVDLGGYEYARDEHDMPRGRSELRVSTGKPVALLLAVKAARMHGTIALELIYE